MLSTMNYEDIVTSVIRSISTPWDLADYVESLIRYKKEDTKNFIRDLCTKAIELGEEVNDLLFYSGWESRDISDLYVLTDKHWFTLRVLYMTIGQDEYDHQMICSESCVNSEKWRKTAKEALNRFLTGFSG